MKPDESFVKKLKEIHRNLSVVWSPSMQIFCIFYKNEDGRSFKITEVRNEDDSFMPLDDRTIIKLRKWDKSKSKYSAKQIADASYEAFVQNQKLQNIKKKEAVRYKGRQLIGFWKRVAEKLWDNKQYVNQSIKPMLRMAQQKGLMQSQTAQLLTKFGMPQKHGKPMKI